MFLKTDKRIVTFPTANPVIMRSSKYGTGPQFVLDETAIAGWDDGVGVRRGTSDTSRPISDGDFPEQGLLGSRTITLTGMAIATNPIELQQLRDTFVGLLNDGNSIEMSVENAAGTRYATVYLGNQPNWTQKFDNSAVWKIDLWAPDPRIYGIKKRFQVPGGLSSVGDQTGLGMPIGYPLDYGGAGAVPHYFMDNNGNIESWPVFTVYGAYPNGFTLTYAGASKKVVYNGPVSFADPVTVDMAAGSATQSGIDKSYNLSSRGWFSIPPGSLIQPQVIVQDLSSGWCDIIFRDTWI